MRNTLTGIGNDNAFVKFIGNANMRKMIFPILLKFYCGDTHGLGKALGL